MFDKDGVLNKQRADLDEMKLVVRHQLQRPLHLTEALKGADVFVGLSVG